jgi:hypothetical protein
MRLIFLAIALIQFFNINFGYAMDDEGINRRGIHQRFQVQRDAAQQAVAPVNGEGFSLTGIISSGFNQIKPALPIIAYLIFRFLQECPGDCPIE